MPANLQLEVIAAEAGVFHRPLGWLMLPPAAAGPQVVERDRYISSNQAATVPCTSRHKDRYLCDNTVLVGVAVYTVELNTVMHVGMGRHAVCAPLEKTKWGLAGLQPCGPACFSVTSAAFSEPL